MPPPPPASLNATPGDAQVDLAWSAVPGAQSYNVKRATSPGGPYTLIAGGVTGAAYTDASVANFTTYYYVVSTIISGVEGADSADMPDLRFETLAVPTTVNPLGVKGVGEAGTVGSLAATINAVNNALAQIGAGPIEMPATPGTVWKAIAEAQDTPAAG